MKDLHQVAEHYQSTAKRLGITLTELMMIEINSSLRELTERLKVIELSLTSPLKNKTTKY